MEFSYRVSEQEFREAQKVFSRYTWRRDRNKVVLWACIFLALLLIWVILHRGNAQMEPLGKSFLEEILVPILAIALIVWLVWLREARKNSLKNPTSNAEFTISLVPEGLTSTNTAGTSSNAHWSSYEFWIEGTNVIVLVLRSGRRLSIINVGMASEEQRNELRAILTQVLPKR